MGEWFGELASVLITWVSDNAVWIATISAVYFVVSLFVIRLLIIRIPVDYFMDGRERPEEGRRTISSAGIRIGKNILGLFVILVGLMMSIPGVAGQGVLTVLIGLSLTDFPGKRRAELRLVRQPLIQRAINAIRAKAGKQALNIPDRGEPAPERD